MLTDSASLQEKDAEFLNKRYLRRKSIGMNGGQPVEPLYTTQDAEATFALFRPTPMHTSTPIGPGVQYTSFEAGHIFGSTSMVLDLESDGSKVRLGFSGDLGRPGLPIVRDPEPLPAVDYLILESTYGGRIHEPIQSAAAKLADIVNRTYHRGGKLIVPAFAVGRTQQLVLLLHELTNAKAIPHFPIFVDSPLAVNVTKGFRQQPELFDTEATDFLDSPRRPVRVQPAHLHKGCGAIQGAQRSARSVHDHLGIRHDGRRADSPPPQEQYRRPAQHDSHHRLSSPKYFGKRNLRAPAGGTDLW